MRTKISARSCVPQMHTDPNLPEIQIIWVAKAGWVSTGYKKFEHSYWRTHVGHAGCHRILSYTVIRCGEKIV